MGHHRPVCHPGVLVCSGNRLEWAEGAKDLAGSKLWAKVQRPALGLYKEDLSSGQVRDVTVIVLAKKP